MTPSTGPKPIRLLQITDCHLGEKPGEKLLGLDTEQSFLDVLQLVKTREINADMAVFSGDIASEGAEAAYHRFLSYIDDQLDCPAAWLAGNHDLASRMTSIESGRIHAGSVELGPWRIVLLDSSVLGSEGGSLAATELSRLQTLLEGTDKPCMVFVHHQPVPLNCEWLDKYTIDNAAEFFAVLDSFDHVKAIVFGHVHQEFSAERKGVKLLATPSTCIQFKPLLADFEVDRKMPGYRWFDLHPDGGFDTGVVRLEEKDYGIDYTSPGY